MKSVLNIWPTSDLVLAFLNKLNTDLSSYNIQKTSSDNITLPMLKNNLPQEMKKITAYAKTVKHFFLKMQRSRLKNSGFKEILDFIKADKTGLITPGILKNHAWMKRFKNEFEMLSTVKELKSALDKGKNVGAEMTLNRIFSKNNQKTNYYKHHIENLVKKRNCPGAKT
jgi:hypothetical protein